MNESPQPLVSVIIPCYNQARFLGEAIASAQRQTHSPVEVIVVDDGSSDDTASVATAHPEVRYIRQRNRGAAAARTAGLHESRGEFLIFLDADDRLLSDAAAIGLEALRAHPDWAFATGHVRLIAQDGAPEGIPPQDHANGNQYVALLRSNYIWTPGVILYRRSTLASIGSFDPAARASADYELNIRIARRAPIGCHHHVVLEYRRHGGNMSADAGEMLRSAVSVRRAQRKHAAGDPAARQAWKEGIEIVKADFGNRLLQQIKADLRTPGLRRRLGRDLLCLARHYPDGLARMLTGRLRSLWSA
jgi:glycosyltransferase involved in cell wall biosynthesis